MSFFQSTFKSTVDSYTTYVVSCPRSSTAGCHCLQAASTIAQDLGDSNDRVVNHFQDLEVTAKALASVLPSTDASCPAVSSTSTRPPPMSSRQLTQAASSLVHINLISYASPPSTAGQLSNPAAPWRTLTRHPSPASGHVNEDQTPKGGTTTPSQVGFATSPPTTPSGRTSTATTSSFPPR